MRRLSVVAAVLVLASCGGMNFLRAGSADLVSTRVCGTHADGKTRTMHLRIELVPSGALPRGAFVEVEFENPTEGGKPLFASHTYDGRERTLAVLSPPVQGVRPRSYQVFSRIYASSDKKKLLGMHTQTCESLVDQRELVQ